MSSSGNPKSSRKYITAKLQKQKTKRKLKSNKKQRTCCSQQNDNQTNG